MKKSCSLLAALATAAALSAGTASAAVYNIVGGWTGSELGDIAFDLTIDADFSGDITETSDGLTIHSLTSSVVAGDPFPVLGGLGYLYVAEFDRFVLGGLGGGVSGISVGTTDIMMVIRDFTTDPRLRVAYDSREGTAGSGRSSVATISVTDASMSPIPLPAGGFLLLGGLLTAAGVGYRKKRAA